MERVIGSAECHVEWHRRDDAPDFFVVRVDGNPAFGTWSRNWAFLAAAEIEGLRPFERRTSALLARNDSFPAHLPVGLGRWVSIASGLPPIPEEGAANRTSYTYCFPNDRNLRDVYDCMWPSIISEELAYRARWIARLVTSGLAGSSVRRVLLPGHVQEIMSACSELPGCETLASLRVVPAPMLPRLMAFASDLAGRSDRSRGHAR